MSIFDTDTFSRLGGLHIPLLQWYDQNKREMPWRGAADSYHVWISEIMLQQTRVEAVRAYFARFVAALPTLQDLAQCDENALLKLWEGLGYYNRVRNMQKAAKIVVEQYGGTLPRDYTALLTLPGIGEYSAGAIASIAYEIPVPCVDGNVLRVLSRITANSADISLPVVKKDYQVLARSIIPPGRAGDFNQSLMELGAMICVPNGAPLCHACPVQTLCAAALAGNPLDYPVKPAKPGRKILKKTVCVVLCGNQVLLWQRPADGLLAGLWEFLSFDGWLTRDELLPHLAEQGLAADSAHTLKAAKHIFTHLEWRMHGFLVYTAACTPVAGAQWVSVPELREHYALPSALLAYSEQLEGWANQ